MHSPIYWWVHFYIKNKKGANNGSTLVCTWFCGNNSRCTRNRKTHHKKLIWRKNMFGLIMALTTKVAVEMFAKGAGTAITLLCTGTKLRKRK